MKYGEFKVMKTAELHAELERLRRHLFDLKSQAVTEKLENPHQLSDTRKEVARVLTCLNQRGETGIEEKQRHMESVTHHQAIG